MGFRESFGLQGQGFRVRAGVQVVGASRLTISRQEQPPPKNPPNQKKNALIRTTLFGTGSNKEKMHYLGTLD